MKGKFTIQSQEYRNALHLLHQELSCRGIDYTVIGGGGVQVHLAKAVDDPVQLQRMLRKTGDIDIAVDADLGELVCLFNELAAEGKASNRSVGNAFVGRVSIQYAVPGDLYGYEDNHSFVMQDGEYVTLSDGIVVKSSSPEALIAAKLSGSFKPKDRLDILNLKEALGEDIDELKIKRILALLGQEDQIDKYKSLTS
jgi:hypothetical protein